MCDDIDLMLDSEVDLNFNIELEDNKIDKRISPIVYASYLGKIEYVEICLMQVGINIDLATEPNHSTALIVSCMTNNYEIVKLLVRNGASLNKLNLLLYNPLTACFYSAQNSQHN